jgi:hypothetical protein
MLRRTIVAIEQNAAGNIVARLTKAEALLAGAQKPVDLQFKPDGLPTLDAAPNLLAYGKQLRDALRVHPAVGSALTNIFQSPPGDTRTLCFDIVENAGESVRWEALCDDQDRFVALEPQWRLGRIADSVANHDTGVRPFAPPLRIAAFISAARRDATPEWEGLAEAVKEARADGLDVEARIYAGQQALLDQATAEINAGKYPKVEIFPIPTTEILIADVLHDWRPHIVHFFCHGSAEAGASSLELATVAEHDNDDEVGSIVVWVDHLVKSGALQDAWLVVLNCCEGAAVAAGEKSDRLNSMAFRIVAEGSVPAVIGMQEAVPVRDANVFSARLYPGLMKQLKEVFDAASGKPTPVDLTAAIGPARRAVMLENYKTPAKFRNWTLPVLYVHREPLQVHLLAAVSAADRDLFLGRAHYVGTLLKGLPPETPINARMELLALLDKHPPVPYPMRPDLYGQVATT